MHPLTAIRSIVLPATLAAFVGLALPATASGAADDQLILNSPPSVCEDSETACGDVSDHLQRFTQWAHPDKVESSIKTIAVLTVLSLAPAILLMTTSYVRIAVVLGLLRQSLGTQMLPSNQVISALALFLTFVIMSPIWQQVYTDAIGPYTDPATAISAEAAWQAGVAPVRRFMAEQIELAQNSEDVWLFLEYMSETGSNVETYEQVPLPALLPAFLLSELKVAFLIGFQIYLPFLIIDLVVASIGTSMGMMMLPPAMISLPLKLILFVLVDGWQLVVGMLLTSFTG